MELVKKASGIEVQRPPVTWDMMTVAPAAPAAPAKASRLYRPPAEGCTMLPAPKLVDIDAERLAASANVLPRGLQMEFTLEVTGRPPAMWLTKTRSGVTSHWAMFALHCDPIYGQYTGRLLPAKAMQWMGRVPWATALMIAHEVPAWCESTYPDPRRLPRSTFVSDLATFDPVIPASTLIGPTAQVIDPILYGVMVAGRHWGFVPLAEWKL